MTHTGTDYLSTWEARERIFLATLDWYKKKITSDELRDLIGREADEIGRKHCQEIAAAFKEES